MFIQPFFIKGIAHISYLLGDEKKCAIIDPARDINIYLKVAKEHGMQITHILETHLHADFISGHLELEKKTKAKIFAPKSANCKFKHVKLKQGDTFKIENIEIKVLEVPGHTPEHIAYVVTDKTRSKEPVCVFCGDALFVGDVGRPDLFPGKAKKLASELYHSLHSKLLKLPDFCEVYPAHGAGSLCGRFIGSKRNSTIGYEKLYNKALQIKDKKQFIKSLITNMPPAPDHFKRCSEINRIGPKLVKNLPELIKLSPNQFKKLETKKNNIVLDIRNYDAYSGMHIPNSYNISIKGNFETFAGWILPPEKNILLVTDSEKQAQDAIIGLRRVGIDKVIGFLEGMKEWSKLGYLSNHVSVISAKELHKMKNNKNNIIVDVRARREFVIENIKNSIIIPVPELRTQYKKLSKTKNLILICNSGNRSSLAASILLQKGFNKLYNVAGGITGYSAAGYLK